MADLSEKMRAAGSERGEKLWEAIKFQHPEVMINAASNRNLTEDMALFIAKSRSAPPEVLGALAGNARFRDSYKFKLALCRNPLTPFRTTLTLLKHLRIFDLADLTRSQLIPVTLRRKAELMLSERVPQLPAGIKVALSRRASASLVALIMERSDRRVINACLDSPLLTEEQLMGLAIRRDTKPLTVQALSEHPKWSLRYSLRLALIRNFHTPMSRSLQFIMGMKSSDLKELYSDPNLPTATKPFIFRELRDRDETVEPAEEVTYELEEEDGDNPTDNLLDTNEE